MPPKTAVMAPGVKPPSISLMTAAVVVPETERWEAGFAYEPEGCASGGAADPCASHTKEIAAGDALIEVEPFLIWAGDRCTPMGAAARDWKGRAARRLAACESALIESEMATGTIARASSWPNRFLASDVTTLDVLSAAPDTPLNALACLESYLRACNCGSRGMIHATAQTVALWSSLGLLRRDGNRVLTYQDTVVVPGNYPGSGPSPTAGGAPVPATAGQVWAYATSMVHLRLAPVVVIPGSIDEALDRTLNLVTFRAERIVAYTWDCCHAAMPIDIDPCDVDIEGS